MASFLEVLDVPTEFISVEFYFLQGISEAFPNTKTQTEMLSKCIAVFVSSVLFHP